MSGLATAGAILSIIAGAGAALCWMVLIVAGMPNSTPQQEAALWRFFWAVGAGGLLCFALAVTLLVYRRAGIAAAVGAVPVVALVAFIFWALAS